jgi:hypothetical protein
LAWYVHTSFSRDMPGLPEFELVDPGSVLEPLPGSAKTWPSQIRSTAKVDPLPDLVAVGAQGSSAEVLPDFLTILHQYVVSTRFKSIVEGLEPGMHQFIPIKVKTGSDPSEVCTYWIVNVLKVINAVLPSAEIARLREIGKIPTQEKLKRSLGPSYTFVDRNLVAGSHLWRTGYISTSADLYFSEELMRQMEEAKLIGLKARPAIEVEPA